MTEGDTRLRPKSLQAHLLQNTERFTGNDVHRRQNFMVLQTPLGQCKQRLMQQGHKHHRWVWRVPCTQPETAAHGAGAGLRMRSGPPRAPPSKVGGMGGGSTPPPTPGGAEFLGATKRHQRKFLV